MKNLLLILYLVMKNKNLLSAILLIFIFQIEIECYSQNPIKKLPVIKEMQPRRYGFREGEKVFSFQKSHIKSYDPSWKILDQSQIQENESIFQLKYFYKKVDDKLIIDYHLPYLDVIEKEGIVYGVDFIGESPFRYYFPRVGVIVNNPSKSPLTISEVVARIDKSELDASPIIVVEEQLLTPYLFTVHNCGWGDAQILDMNIGFASISNYGNSSVFERGFDFKIDPFSLKDKENFYVKDIIPENLKNHSRIICYGVFNYSTEDSKTKKLFFIVKIQIEKPYPGRYIPASKIYDLKLVAGKSGYTERIPTFQHIKPKSVDRFDIRVTTDKSAYYELNLSLIKENNEELSSQDINISIFRSKNIMQNILDPNLHDKVPSEQIPSNLHDKIQAITIDPEKSNYYYVFPYKEYFENNERIDFQEIINSIAKKSGHKTYQFFVIDSQGNGKNTSPWNIFHNEYDVE